MRRVMRKRPGLVEGGGITLGAATARDTSTQAQMQ